MDFSFITHQGLGKYTNNQDSIGHLELGDTKLFIVCDGVGGLPYGEQSSACAVNNIINTFKSSSNLPSNNILKNAFLKSNTEIRNLSDTPSGTTVVAVILQNNIAWCSWVGDSRIYHLKNQKISWISKDHNVLYDLINKGNLYNNISLNPNALTRYLGKNNHLQPDFHNLKLMKTDYLLLCSDGLSDFIDESILINTIYNNSPKNATSILKEMLLSNRIQAPDNFSWYIIKL